MGSYSFRPGSAAALLVMALPTGVAYAAADPQPYLRRLPLTALLQLELA